MPLSQILRLNWRWKQKLGAAMMFAVAFLITLVSVLRLESIKSFMKTSNPTWDIVPISNWSFVELNGFIFCSCMPAFRDYFRRLVRRRRLAESTHANQDRIQTIGNLAVRRGNRIHELVSVDSDEGEQNRSEVDVNDRTHNTGRYSVDLNGLHHTSASAQPPADIQVAEAEPQPEEIDLADLKYLAEFDVPTQRISEPEKVHTASEEAQI
ncbi:CFEM domain-containing protein [Colletotrichum truncatum]|uniref:CFEM domain-containing protein n=1 Tax=Colletotrichum truncatum TaxID=5467 RepID=A0ACC3ZGI1_COLTU|nr:CFEM domain-containing protein [Colletotrichum truncatum]KAF6784720.1 CFEM domain-containing protein [Colletotrichum truncatum]